MRIMSDKAITKEEVTQAITEVEQKFEKKFKQMVYIAIASCWVSISTLVFLLIK